MHNTTPKVSRKFWHLKFCLLSAFTMAIIATANVAGAEDTNINTNNVNNNTTTSTSTNTNNNFNTSTSTSNNTNTNINTTTETSNQTIDQTVNSTVNQTTNSTVNSTSNNTNTNVNTSTSTNTNNNNNVNTTTSNNTNTNTNNNTSDNTNRNINSGTTTSIVKSPPPSAISPSIISNNADLCTTGVSGAVQTQILGISGGATVRDLNCERLKLSKTLFDMGMKVAAVSVMCQDERVFAAMEMAGTPCPFMGDIGPEAAVGWATVPGLRPDYETWKDNQKYIDDVKRAIAEGNDPSKVKHPNDKFRIKDVPEFMWGLGAGALLLLLL